MGIDIIIEIVLATAAWNRGWKGWALVPVALGWLVYFMFLFMGVDIGLLICLVEFGVLIGMIVKQRKPKVTVNPMVRPMAGNLGNGQFCMNCGQQQFDNAVFCRNCGYQLQNNPGVIPNAEVATR